MKPPKIILAGGSGFIGQLLIEHWKKDRMEAYYGRIFPAD
ncbi:hypothetical protein SAMN05216167_104384 [Spirosoma endophyticum]|uniref:NAD dependent epimerase/dehydratase family protein n=1 Tax=Spirosoma endophyticum TaxID=662367 RepID=A0A1I1RFH3_9BACT|nr:hypothetical protein SAMN05216167_104384 [Spirosoma endophyticum]